MCVRLPTQLRGLTADLHPGGQRFEAGRPFAIKELTHALDYSLFDFALGKLNITQAMSEKSRTEYLEKIKKAKTVFDEKQLIGLAQNAEGLFKKSSMETVRQVFNQLIGISYRADAGSHLEKKTDNLRKVEKVFRIGFSDACLDYGRISCAGWRYGSASNVFHFNDLLTACRLIEGEGFTDYSNSFDFMVRAIPRELSQTWVDTGYFKVQAYKNGNVKVKWNEEKIHILEKLNAVGSGRENDLPDVQRKRYKPEHFHNGGAQDPFTFFRPDPKMQPSDDKDFAFYPTQDSAALRMVALAEYEQPLHGDPTMSTLEPSAGDGKLMQVIPFAWGSMAVEFNHHRVQKIRAIQPPWEVWEADFLKWETDKKFDRVLMNPPFNDRVEAVHVVKAFGHLRPGGILVGIIPEGWFTREDQRATVFRAFLQAYQYKPSEKLPAGSFKRTRVETRIIILKKPLETP